MLQIFATPQFRKDLRKIPENIKLEADFAIAHLRQNPFDPILNSQKLRDFNPAVWRVRIGAYRLIYAFDKSLLTLLRLRHRKDVYRNL
jgi:mRNA-degrading endonuclease RelE of RelBE toxin-antitoxin system